MKLVAKWNPEELEEFVLPQPIDPFVSFDAICCDPDPGNPMVVGPEAIYWFGVVQERMEYNYALTHLDERMAKQMADAVDRDILRVLGVR